MANFDVMLMAFSLKDLFYALLFVAAGLAGFYVVYTATNLVLDLIQLNRDYNDYYRGR